MFKVSAVPPRRSAMLTVFRGATAINDGTTAEPLRPWRCNYGLCRTSTAVAPRLRCDGGIRRATIRVQTPFLCTGCKAKSISKIKLAKDNWKIYVIKTAGTIDITKLDPYFFDCANAFERRRRDETQNTTIIAN